MPLRETDLAALAHSAMALDIYAWLAQRLHRIAYKQTVFVPWEALHQQFGPDYVRINQFRRPFLAALRQVCVRYPDARIEQDKRGITLRNSPPPVAKRMALVERGAPVDKALG